MAFFIACGIISNDIVRRETRAGVLATFRLETGAPRGGRLWIDIECWGHLAGTIAHHGAPGRHVSVSGRLTQKSWRDKATGDARCRYVVTAADIDLLTARDQSTLTPLPNSVLLHGTIESVLPARPAGSGTVATLRVTTGRAGSKTGRFDIAVEHWSPGDVKGPDLRIRADVRAIGGLRFTAGTDDVPGSFVLSTRTLSHS